jgi:hypothetical protein
MSKSRVRIDAVLDECGNCLERVALRERDDAECVPVVPYLELTAVVRHRRSAGVEVKGLHFEPTGRALGIDAGVAQKSQQRVSRAAKCGKKYDTVGPIVNDTRTGTLQMITSRVV